MLLPIAFTSFFHTLLYSLGICAFIHGLILPIKPSIILFVFSFFDFFSSTATTSKTSDPSALVNNSSVQQDQSKDAGNQELQVNQQKGKKAKKKEKGKAVDPSLLGAFSILNFNIKFQY